ncbi:hypothetical protein BJ165DRAFT_1397549 [Panaeolus papilionaceus]|nr:hypothetical protein BJ165DRAFT_1397549 [Panaeolus papilionaceus]
MIKLDEDWGSSLLLASTLRASTVDEHLYSWGIPNFWTHILPKEPPYKFYKGEWYSSEDMYFTKPVPYSKHRSSTSNESRGSLRTRVGSPGDSVEEDVADSESVPTLGEAVKIDDRLLKEQEGLFKMLTSATYNRKNSDLPAHLAYMKVIRDGLKQYQISDGDFNCYILDSLVVSNAEHDVWQCRMHVSTERRQDLDAMIAKPATNVDTGQRAEKVDEYGDVHYEETRLRVETQLLASPPRAVCLKEDRTSPAAELGRLIVFFNFGAKKQGKPHADPKEVTESLVDYEDAMEELRRSAKGTITWYSPGSNRGPSVFANWAQCKRRLRMLERERSIIQSIRAPKLIGYGAIVSFPKGCRT